MITNDVTIIHVYIEFNYVYIMGKNLSIHNCSPYLNNLLKTNNFFKGFKSFWKIRKLF